MYLITKWFGVFLFDKRNLIKSIIFSKDPKIISKKIFKIQSNQILPEEKKIIKNLKEVIVNEKRLKAIGDYIPTDPFFKNIEIKAEKYGFSKEVFFDTMQLATKYNVDNRLESEDLQIIQMVNTLDDFIQTSNLLSERIESWSVIPTPAEKIKPLKKAYSTINDEIKTLENLIEEDMTRIAPNIAQIIGPLIGARLISHSSGILKLATMPSSTIQILGAEKALFRYKKEGGKPPKHGVIFQHPLINKASRNNRGKIARTFALKIAIAAKADAFTKRDISEDLKIELNKRIKEINNKKS
jgi:nucleolar protein 56